jgi:signal peptidase I
VREVSGVQSSLSITVIVIFVITFVVQAFRVPSESMENTLLIGDFLLADKVRFADQAGAWDGTLPYQTIHRGDIIVFRYPVEPSIYFVKRVIGLPGDRIRLRRKVVYLNGAPLQESYVIHKERDSDLYRDNFPAGSDFPKDDCLVCRDLPRYVRDNELVVPEGRYFVMGDNRDQSSDSRYWGFVPQANIVGRPLVIYLSVRGFSEDKLSTSGDKLIPSGQMLAHIFHLGRWNRMLRLVR